MKTISTLTAVLALAGCGSYPLGTAYATNGQTQAELDAALAVCQRAAENATATTERNIKGAVLRATIIGAPVAVQTERYVARQEFARCMTERGYKVVPPT
jgi:hypothetical protein